MGSSPRQKARRSPHFKVLGTLFFCVGVVFIGLITGDDPPLAIARRDPMRGYFPPQMPHYPEARAVPAGDNVVSGAPSKMAYFITAHDPARVADFYIGAWRKQKLWVRHSVTHLGGVVSAVDGDQGQVFQVLLMARGGKTLVFPSVTQRPKRAEQATKPPPIELYPKSEIVVDTVTRAGPHWARLLISTNGGTVTENRAHYRGALGAAGYRPSGPQKDASALHATLAQTMMIYRHKEQGEITLVISPVDEETTRIQISVVRER